MSRYLPRPLTVVGAALATTLTLAIAGPIPRICPDARYFSMPAAPVGGVAFMTCALNCRPWVRSVIQVPEAVTNSPAPIVASRPRGSASRSRVNR